MRSAFIDESVHDIHGLYCVGVVVARAGIRTTAELALSRLVPEGDRPHWHHENDKTRLALIEAISVLDLDAQVCACRFAKPRRKEAARCAALRHLASGLPEDVTELVLDGRQEAQNENDRRVLSSAVGRRPGFRYHHASSRDEPMLWLADIIVGAVARDLVDGSFTLRDSLGQVLTAVHCQP